jgi:uncharacterized membrane protein
MSHLVAIAYPEVATAQRVADELRDLVDNDALELDDMVVIERTSEGKVKLHQSHSEGGKGAVAGGVGGMMIGFIFFAPLLGAALGAAAGAAVGHQHDAGVEDDFMDRVGVQLRNGGGAVVVLVRRSTPDLVVPHVAQFGGEVVQTSLAPEKEAELKDALAGQGAAA